MRRPGPASLVLAFVVLIGTTVLVARLGHPAPPASPAVTVHEWGTFTSVAGRDGTAVDWSPLSGPSDLPCFVTMLNPSSVKWASGWLSSLRSTVRMETPVLYFYSPREATVRVRVRFRQGLITEWYPQAAVAPAAARPDLRSTTGEIDWTDVRILPGASPSLPTEAHSSHYYAARETDASPVQVGAQFEKFLFYRGLASFPVPLAATVGDDDTIEVENTGGHVIRHLMLFERDGDRMGFRVLGPLQSRMTLDRPELQGNLASLRASLRQVLIGEGLYPREAEAMLNTWEDSWFEEGTRLFYVVPPPAVDAILPLQIDPKPASVARVFVGRLEIITPGARARVERAMRTNDLSTLARYGRFLEPIVQEIQAGGLSTIDLSKLPTAPPSSQAACR